MRQLVEPHLMKISAYIPGLSINAMKTEFGHDSFVKLASNEGAFGPSPLAMEAVKSCLFDSHRYPTQKRESLKDQIIQYLSVGGIDRRHIVLGNGSNEIITLLSRTFLAPNEILLNAWPSFMVYRLSAAAMNREELTVPLDSNLSYDLEGMMLQLQGEKLDRVKLVFIGNPNNPTGHYISNQQLSRFFEVMPPHIVIVIDEAYFEYVAKEDYSSSIEWVLRRPRTVVLRTFSKIFGLAGLRIGFAVCDPEIAQILHKVRDPFNVNNLAQEAAIMALQDKAHVEQGRSNNLAQMDFVKASLKAMDLWVSESVGNFILMRLTDKMTSSEAITQEFLKRGVIVRPVSNYDLPRYLRVTIGRPEENQIFLSALSDILNHI